LFDGWFLSLLFFTSIVPSWVSSRMSHISFADAHLETLENSLEFKAEVMMFLARQSYLLEYMALNERGGELFKKDFRKLLSLE